MHSFCFSKLCYLLNEEGNGGDDYWNYDGEGRYIMVVMTIGIVMVKEDI